MNVKDDILLSLILNLISLIHASTIIELELISNDEITPIELSPK